MGYNRSMEKNGLLVNRGTGIIDSSAVMVSLMQMKDHFGDDVRELVIHDGDVTLDLPSQDIESLTHTFQMVFRNKKRAVVAFVADSNLLFGLCRQLQMRMEDKDVIVSVFRSEEPAREWIGHYNLSPCQ